MQGKEITFEVDKYKRPVLLSQKESIVKTIINAFFMVPGNNPAAPTRGVNIMQYLYRITDEIDSNKILSDLRATCGESFSDNTVKSLNVESAKTKTGDDVTVISIRLQLPGETEDDALMILLKRTDDRVHFNYQFMSDVLKVVA